MKPQIFRSKSVERVSSPEQLNDYIRATNPGLWTLLAAIIFLLAGVCVWGVYGRLDTTLPVAAICNNGTITCYVKETDAAPLQSGMTVKVNNELDLQIDSISAEPVVVDETFDSYALHIGGLAEGEWVYAVYVKAQLADGVYPADIVMDSVSPISFVLN